MIREIKKVALLGANGTMGYGSGALFTSADCEVVFLARTKEKANQGLEAAQNQVRSHAVAAKAKVGDYENDLPQAVAEADLIFEAVAEDFALKNEIFEKVDRYRRLDSIVATVSSGLSITKLAETRSPSFRENFLGIHYFNPPNVIVGTEVVPGKGTNPELVDFVLKWCERQQQRVVIKAFDRPAFAGNRVGFKVLNEVAQLAETYGPAFMDGLIGPYTGRALAPLATIDLVGWDVHKAIVDNVVKHVTSQEDEAYATYQLPAYMQKLIEKGVLGNKTKGGFFKRINKETFVLNVQTENYEPLNSVARPQSKFLKEIQELHSYGKYRPALQILASAQGEEAQLVQKVIGGYISYSFHRVGEVTEDITGIDLIMGCGFNWAPPSVLVDLIGLKETVAMLERVQVPVPALLKQALKEGRTAKFFNHPTINIGKFFVAK